MSHKKSLIDDSDRVAVYRGLDFFKMGFFRRDTFRWMDDRSSLLMVPRRFATLFATDRRVSNGSRRFSLRIDGFRSSLHTDVAISRKRIDDTERFS